MKATKAQVEARVIDLLRVILDGAEKGWDLCEYVREQEQEPASCWHVAEGGKPLSYSQIRRYAEKAEERIVKSVRTSRKRQLRMHLAKRRALYAKAIAQGDIRAALACVDSEAKLCGLFDDELTRQLDRMQKQIEEMKRDGERHPTPTGQADASGPGGAVPPGDGHAPPAEAGPGEAAV
jgi:hypothetical protein